MITLSFTCMIPTATNLMAMTQLLKEHSIGLEIWHLGSFWFIQKVRARV